MTAQSVGIVVRRLTKSDLGLFLVQRPRLQSKQRAININSRVAESMLSDEEYTAGQTMILAQRVDLPSSKPEHRPIRKTGKNWRLGGPGIPDADLAEVETGDLFVGNWQRTSTGQGVLKWSVVKAGQSPDKYKALSDLIDHQLIDGMTFVGQKDKAYTEVCELLAGDRAIELPPVERLFENYQSEYEAHPNVAKKTRNTPPPPRPLSREISETKRPKTVRERISSPHILEDMYRVAGELSGPAQQEFFEVVSILAEQLRELLVASDLIKTVERDHSALWGEMQGKLIGHVDGGMANLPALGSAPIAIRVGTYLVRPGDRSEKRESFQINPQLVDELFAGRGGGAFKSLYPDMGAVRDTARISMEAAGAVNAVNVEETPDVLLMHGALVNPVSRYTDMEDTNGDIVSFPEFSESALSTMLPDVVPPPTGDNAQFISVYLRQLERLKASETIVCGVVERPGPSNAVSNALLASIPDHEMAPLVPDPPPTWRKWFADTLSEFRIGDALLFRCVLSEREYLVPVEIDRNELRRAPEKWRDDYIAKYPKPWISYLLPSDWAGTIRVEIFEKDVHEFDFLVRFLVHSAMLLPGYAFPVGLDTADKFAKVPNWMGRPINTHVVVSALKRAMDTGDSKQIDAIRHLLCGTERDFFFRPKP